MPILLKRIAQDTSGATAIEYGLIASLVVIAAMTALSGVADENTGLWAVVTDKVSVAMGSD